MREASTSPRAQICARGWGAAKRNSISQWPLRHGDLMGKITGFLEIERQERTYAPASDRVRHFREFVIPLEERDVERQAARCMDCGIPYCHRGCPVNNQIP